MIGRNLPPTGQRDINLVEHLRERGIASERVLEAMRRVPRHLFVPEELQERAYEDTALEIGENQMISAPYLVAFMTQLLDLQPTDRVLEVGTGSGYHTAVLCELLTEGHIYSMERHSSLATQAEERLKLLDYQNFEIRTADGSMGQPEFAPFDAVLVSAACPFIPGPLYAQAKREGGRLVLPVGTRAKQELQYIRRDGKQLHIDKHGDVQFVPLIGRYGWRESKPSPSTKR